MVISFCTVSRLRYVFVLIFAKKKGRKFPLDLRFAKISSREMSSLKVFAHEN